MKTYTSVSYCFEDGHKIITYFRDIPQEVKDYDANNSDLVMMMYGEEFKNLDEFSEADRKIIEHQWDVIGHCGDNDWNPKRHNRKEPAGFYDSHLTKQKEVVE